MAYNFPDLGLPISKHISISSNDYKILQTEKYRRMIKKTSDYKKRQITNL